MTKSIRSSTTSVVGIALVVVVVTLSALACAPRPSEEVRDDDVDAGGGVDAGPIGPSICSSERTNVAFACLHSDDGSGWQDVDGIDGTESAFVTGVASNLAPSDFTCGFELRADALSLNVDDGDRVWTVAFDVTKATWDIADGQVVEIEARRRGGFYFPIFEASLRSDGELIAYLGAAPTTSDLTLLPELSVDYATDTCVRDTRCATMEELTLMFDDGLESVELAPGEVGTVGDLVVAHEYSYRLASEPTCTDVGPESIWFGVGTR